MKSNILAALCVSRRVVSIAVFDGPRLEYTRPRQLSSSLTQAEQSVMSIVNWLSFQFEIDTLGLLDSNPEARAARLETAAELSARNLAIPLWKVATADLYQAFALPTLRGKHELRKIVQGIWPELENEKTAREASDAAAVGLFVQVERLLAQAVEAEIP